MTKGQCMDETNTKLDVDEMETRLYLKVSLVRRILSEHQCKVTHNKRQV